MDSPSPLRRRLLAVAYFLVSLVPQGALAGALTSGEAPGPKSQSSNWSSSRLAFLGTARANDTASRVWFTGFNGIIGQVFYPRVDTPATVDWQFLIGDSAHTWVDEEKVDATSQVVLIDPRALSWKVTNTAKNGKYRIEKTIFTDPARHSLVVRVTFTALAGTLGNFNLYTLYHPALDDDGVATTANTAMLGGMPLLAAQNVGNSGILDQGSASALVTSLPFRPGMLSSGFVGVSDGWQDLKGAATPDFTMNWTYDSATSGNVAQMGQFNLDPVAANTSTQFDLVLGFGPSASAAAQTAQATLGDDLDAMLTAYNNGWHAYTAGLSTQGGTADQQYYVAAMSLKTVQDKGTGAMVAGLGVPWGADTGVSDGYHVVFPRDLYKFSSALIVAGDSQTPSDALDFLFNTMQEADGRFPRYVFVDGKAQESPQLDQTAFPIVLAWKLGRTDLPTYQKHIKPAADYLVRNGPRTGAERWEEAGGYSPSTIAAEIAGLVCAADIARVNNDLVSQTRYLLAADYWQGLVESWTFTTHRNGGTGRYYERIDDDGNPENGHNLSIASCGGDHDERAIVDAGFLELVRHGVKPADDPYILASLKAVDATIQQTIASKGNGFFRYNFDGYGESQSGTGWPKAKDLCATNPFEMGIGRLWPILTGERGHHLVASGGDASAQLATMRGFASASFLIPEQVFDNNSVPLGFQPGDPTLSMCPLSWAMGEYITLLGSNTQKQVLDRPQVVSQRYVAGAFTPDPQKKVDFPAAAAVQGHALTIDYKGALASAAQVTIHWGYDNWQGTTDQPMIQRNDGFWQATVPIPTTAAELNLAFTDGTNWDNNNGSNWNLPIAAATFRTTVTPVDAWPAPAPEGQPLTIYYKGPLAAAATAVTLHYGYSGLSNWIDLPMTKQTDGYWTATLQAPKASAVQFALFDQNHTWDNNNLSNYSVAVIPR